MLPVVHPELNPIELAWAFMKNKIAFHNFEYNIKAVEMEAKQVLATVDKDLFTAFCRRSMKEKDKYREMGEGLDLTTEVAEVSAPSAVPWISKKKLSNEILVSDSDDGTGNEGIVAESQGV